ncbi:MAG: cytochrome c maturation protein CcmE [Solirubrobacterales bacterium]|nr:cytochrome c maturation protein CcmE [Solirubrobacterales bacterium]
MDQDRKRKIRLVVALTAAVLLAVALVYTSFSAGTEAREPSEVLAAGPSSETYQLTGEVKDYKRDGADLEFDITDREGGEALPVAYSGVVPDPFREGREVIVTGRLDESGTFMAEKDSLITKCPSKFADEAAADPEHVVIEQ